MSSGSGKGSAQGQAAAGDGKAAGQSDLDARMKALEERELRIAQREQELEERESIAEAGGRKFNPRSKPYRGPTPYKFRVGPLSPKWKDKLETIEIEAVDESEAKRWYAESHEDPEHGGKAIDTVRIELTAVCIDPRRAQNQARHLRLANIRAKRESGVALDKNEEAMLLEADEAAILGRAA